jgi:hypothetical protein
MDPQHCWEGQQGLQEIFFFLNSFFKELVGGLGASPEA